MQESLVARKAAFRLKVEYDDDLNLGIGYFAVRR